MLNAEELQRLREARRLLETPSLAVRLTDLLGKPLEKGLAMLPDRAARTISAIVKSALERALGVAVATMGKSETTVSSDGFHKLAGATAGALGGAFGLAGLAVELPVTTVIMLRSIGDVARSEGHDLGELETRLACLEVFALGGPSRSDDAAETGYYAVRAALAKLVSDAAQHIAQRGMSARGAPALVRLLERIATRFGILVEEKVALEVVPAIGALSGALINTVFIAHFQNTARGHFIVKALESKHGVDGVREAYERLV